MINSVEPTIGGSSRKQRPNLSQTTRRKASAPKPFVLTDDRPQTDATTPSTPIRESGATSLRRYLKEACEEPLLTVQEEIELAARIQDGDEAARERMIKANLRFVVKIARDYENLGLPLMDLISEGNIGLMRAVDKFDPAKGGKLSTYSSWWIKQQMRRAITNQSKTIRLPAHAVEKAWELRKISARVQKEEGREATVEEMSSETGYSRKKIAAIMESSARPASLDARIGDDSSSERSELIADDNAENPAAVLATKNSIGIMAKLLKHLPGREIKILTRRFGLDGAEPLTLTEIGEELGVTRERIRQLQNQALSRLRGFMAELDNEAQASL
jgi:RNA polymerase primary sigma factor